MSKRAIPLSERDVYYVPEFGRKAGLSRASAYNAVARGDVPSVNIGGRILIPKAAADKLLAGQQAAAPAA